MSAWTFALAPPWTCSLADDHGGGYGADAALLEQLRCVCLDKGGELGEQLALLLLDRVDPLQLGRSES